MSLPNNINFREATAWLRVTKWKQRRMARQQKQIRKFAVSVFILKLHQKAAAASSSEQSKAEVE